MSWLENVHAMLCQPGASGNICRNTNVRKVMIHKFCMHQCFHQICPDILLAGITGIGLTAFADAGDTGTTTRLTLTADDGSEVARCLRDSGHSDELRGNAILRRRTFAGSASRRRRTGLPIRSSSNQSCILPNRFAKDLSRLLPLPTVAWS